MDYIAAMACRPPPPGDLLEQLQKLLISATHLHTKTCKNAYLKTPEFPFKGKAFIPEVTC